MVQLNRVRVALTGFPGGPGVSTFYFLNLATARQSLQTLYTAMAPSIPNDVTIQVESTGDVIESSNGQLVGTWAEGALPVIFGGDPGSYAAPAGALVRWTTGAIVAGKRVRGRTFFVPLAGGVFGPSGQLAANFPSDVEVATDAFVFQQSADFVIWSRPFAGAAAVPSTGPGDPGRPARPPRLGVAALVTGSTVPPKVVVLRSRRD